MFGIWKTPVAMQFPDGGFIAQPDFFLGPHPLLRSASRLKNVIRKGSIPMTPDSVLLMRLQRRYDQLNAKF